MHSWVPIIYLIWIKFSTAYNLKPTQATLSNLSIQPSNLNTQINDLTRLSNHNEVTSFQPFVNSFSKSMITDYKNTHIPQDHVNSNVAAASNNNAVNDYNGRNVNLHDFMRNRNIDQNTDRGISLSNANNEKLFASSGLNSFSLQGNHQQLSSSSIRGNIEGKTNNNFGNNNNLLNNYNMQNYASPHNNFGDPKSSNIKNIGQSFSSHYPINNKNDHHPNTAFINFNNNLFGTQLDTDIKMNNYMGNFDIEKSNNAFKPNIESKDSYIKMFSSIGDLENKNINILSSRNSHLDLKPHYDIGLSTQNIKDGNLPNAYFNDPAKTFHNSLDNTNLNAVRANNAASDSNLPNNHLRNLIFNNHVANNQINSQYNNVENIKGNIYKANVDNIVANSHIMHTYTGPKSGSKNPDLEKSLFKSNNPNNLQKSQTNLYIPNNFDIQFVTNEITNKNLAVNSKNGLRFQIVEDDLKVQGPVAVKGKIPVHAVVGVSGNYQTDGRAMVNDMMGRNNVFSTL